MAGRGSIAGGRKPPATHHYAVRLEGEAGKHQTATVLAAVRPTKLGTYPMRRIPLSGVGRAHSWEEGDAWLFTRPLPDTP